MASQRKQAKGQKRAPKGSGTVFWSESRGCHVARKTVKGRRVEGYGKTETLAIKARDAKVPPTSNMRLSEWCDRWVESADVREQTRDLYRRTARLRIKPHLGKFRVCEVTAFDVEAAARKWGKTVGANSVRKYLGHLQSCFAAAERARLVHGNPVRIAKKPAGTLPDIDPFTVDEVRQIVDAACAKVKWHRLAIVAATGCRIGEAQALKPSDYNPATGELSIARTATRRHGDGAPKSARSLRTIRVPVQVQPACRALGPALSYKTARRRWTNLLKSLGIRVRGIHQARHAMATHMLAAGVPVGDVAKYLGDHPATIIARYLHASGTDACAAIEGLLGDNRVHEAAAGGGEGRENPPIRGKAG